MISQRVKAHIALGSVAIFYGLNYTIAKEVMGQGYLTPPAFIVLRVGFVLLMMTLIHAIWIRQKMAINDIAYTFLLSIFGVAVNMLSFFQGLKFTSASHASLIMIMTPVLVLLFSAVLIKEKITFHKVLGIFLGLAGAALLIVKAANGQDSLSSLKGDLFILTNASSYAVYLVLVKKLASEYHPITILKNIFLFGFIIVLPFGWSDLNNHTEWSSFPDHVILSIAYVLLFATFLAYLLNVYALNILMPSTIGFYVYFQPLIAVGFAVLMGKDSIDGLKLLSASLLFTGVYMVLKRPR